MSWTATPVRSATVIWVSSVRLAENLRLELVLLPGVRAHGGDVGSFPDLLDAQQRIVVRRGGNDEVAGGRDLVASQGGLDREPVSAHVSRRGDLARWSSPGNHPRGCLRAHTGRERPCARSTTPRASGFEADPSDLPRPRCSRSTLRDYRLLSLKAGLISDSGFHCSPYRDL